MSSYYQMHRIDWIVDTVRIYGFINRKHIQRKFGVSTPQAALDIKRARQAHPNLMAYNTVKKRYELRVKS